MAIVRASRAKETPKSRASMLYKPALVRLYLGNSARLSTAAGVNSALMGAIDYLKGKGMLGLIKPFYGEKHPYAACENILRFGEVPKPNKIKNRPLSGAQMAEANQELLIHYGRFIPADVLKAISAPRRTQRRGLKRRPPYGDGGTEHIEALRP